MHEHLRLGSRNDAKRVPTSALPPVGGLSRTKGFFVLGGGNIGQIAYQGWNDPGLHFDRRQGCQQTIRNRIRIALQLSIGMEAVEVQALNRSRP